MILGTLDCDRYKKKPGISTILGLWTELTFYWKTCRFYLVNYFELFEIFNLNVNMLENSSLYPHLNKQIWEKTHWTNMKKKFKAVSYSLTPPIGKKQLGNLQIKVNSSFFCVGNCFEVSVQNAIKFLWKKAGPNYDYEPIQIYAGSQKSLILQRALITRRRWCLPNSPQ